MILSRDDDETFRSIVDLFCRIVAKVNSEIDESREII